MTDSPAAPDVRPDTDADVVVIGGGPIGLAVARGIARAGRRVLVLEKDATTAEHSRAPAIWPRSQELLDGLGVLDVFVAAAPDTNRGDSRAACVKVRAERGS